MLKPAFTAERTDDKDFTVSVSEDKDALGYNILWGHRADKLYHSYLVMGSEIRGKRIGALVSGQDCYVRIDAFNENGITYGGVKSL